VHIEALVWCTDEKKLNINHMTRVFVNVAVVSYRDGEETVQNLEEQQG
jgi:hypothetical protein